MAEQISTVQITDEFSVVQGCVVQYSVVQCSLVQYRAVQGRQYMVMGAGQYTNCSLAVVPDWFIQKSIALILEEEKQSMTLITDDNVCRTVLVTLALLRSTAVTTI